MALTATSNGSTTTFIDAIRLAAARESGTGRQWVGTSGSNDGVVRSCTQSGTTLTLSSAVTSTATSDTADLYNKRGTGWLYEEYNRVLDQVVEDAAGFGMIEVVDDVSEFDADSPEVAVDASLAYVHKVEWQDSDDKWHTVPAATDDSRYGWYADPVGGSIWIEGAPQRWVDGMALQITGYGRQSAFASDSATCVLNTSWVVAQACFRLCRSGMDRDPGLAQKVLMYRDDALLYARRMRRYWSPDAKLVRVI